MSKSSLHLALQFSIRLAKWNPVLDRALTIQDAKLARPKAGAVLRIINCLTFLWEHRLDAESFKSHTMV